MKPVLHSFHYALDFLRAQVDTISPTDMVAQPHGITNHPAWTIGHLTFISQMIGGVISVPAWLPDDFAKKYGSGSTPIGDARIYEPKDLALAMLRDAQSRLTPAVLSLTDSDLNKPFPDPA